MREVTIILHTLFGLDAGTALLIGVGAALVMSIAGIGWLLHAHHSPGRGWTTVGWSFILSGILLGGAFLGLSATIHRADVTGMEQAAGISDITGWDWLDMRTARTITYTRAGEPYETRLLISQGRATIRITPDAGE